MFALCGQIFQGKMCHQNRAMHLYVCNIQQLSVETYLHACKMQEQSEAKIQSKEDGNHGINTLIFLQLLRQSAKIKMTPAKMNCKLGMPNVFLISPTSGLPPWIKITDMQNTYVISKEVLWKNIPFFFKEPKN